MSDVPVALRVKRRRDCAAVPAEIILETSSRPASAEDALASTLQQTLAVSSNHHGVFAPPEGPAKKRCRYVLVSRLAAAAALDNASPAAAGPLEQQATVKDGPILELWHTSGLRDAPAAAGSGGSIGSQTAAASAARQPPSMPAMLEQHGGIYAAMLQEYMQEQQQHQQQRQQEVGAGTAGTKQRGPCRGPSKRAHRSSADTPSSSSATPATPQQQQPQQQQLPPYMTRGMLKHYGLWQGSHSQQQQQHDCVPAPNSADPQHSSQDSAAAPSGDSMDADYTYDVYVAAPVDGAADGDSSSSGQGANASRHTAAAAAAAAAGGSSSTQPGAGAVYDGSGLLSSEDSLDLPVVQVMPL
jgi:hypothetical protein